MSKQSKQHYRFLIGFTIYSAAMITACLLPNPRHSILGFILTNVFAIWILWWKVTHPGPRFLTALLIFSLIALPTNRAQADPQKNMAMAIVGCVVIVVGGIVVYHLYKMCKRLLPNPPPPPSTNAPPAGTSQPQPNPSLLQCPARLNGPDVEIAAVPQWQMSIVRFQSSINSLNWRDEYTVTNWLSDNQLVSVCASNGVPLMTNFVALDWTNETVVSDFSAVMPAVVKDAVKLWRSVELP